MTQPVPYTPATNFQQDETDAVAGRSTVRTPRVDVELQAISLTLSQILTNLAIIQRDDTQLRDLVVTTASLSANVKALFAGGINPRGIWLTATAYAVKDVVETLTPLISYVCVIAHTSGVFATDRTAGKWMVLGSEPGTGIFTDITLSTGGIALSTNNTQDLAATANRFRSGYFGTTVFAGTSVVTPSVDGGASDLTLSGSGSTSWTINAGGSFLPSGDNTMQIGAVANRVSQVVTPIIDSGTAGSLSLKTNNGNLGLELVHNANTTTWNRFTHFPGSVIWTAAGPANSGVFIVGKGTGTHTIQTGATADDGTGGVTQLQIPHTASASRNITITGSNGGNPTIDVTGGNLAITPNLVLAGSITLSTAVSKLVPGATSFSHRNNADSADNILITDAGIVSLRNLLDLSNAAAGQIKFPAAQNASTDLNTLDDYEEDGALGWTASLTFGGAATGWVFTSTNPPRAVKIGKFVWASYEISVTTKGSAAGSCLITGLPYTAATTGAGGGIVHDWQSMLTNFVHISNPVVENSTTAKLMGLAATGASLAQLTDAAFQNGSVIRGVICYKASA